MTHKEENIVNIAMCAAELLKDGRIQRDDVSGHAGLTDTIIFLAEAFEQKIAGVDFDAEDREYWLEIDDFAEKELLDRYGVAFAPRQEPLEIKIIIDNGITEAVLKNQPLPLNVEMVDIDEEYEDYEQLDAYRKQLYADKSFTSCDYTTAHFDEEEIIEAPRPSLNDILREASAKEAAQKAPEGNNKGTQNLDR